MNGHLSKFAAAKTFLSLAVVTALVFLASSNQADAFPITFKVIKADNAPGTCGVLEATAVCGNSTVNIAKFISGDVTDGGSGSVSIKLALNPTAGGMNAPANAELKEIYFENPGGVLGATITAGTHAGSSYITGSPGNCGIGQLGCTNSPPGANQVNPSFNPAFQAKFANRNDNGINVGQMAIYTFSANFAAVRNAFINDTLRIGIHAQSLPGGDGESDSFISMAMGTEVPEPATLSLLGIGLLGAGIARRRRTR